MPRPSTRISIPAPCTQNWEQMTPTAQGRHCQACQLPVVDFSQLSDAEVVAFFERAPATACGRFAAQQLERPLLGAVPPPPRWRSWLTGATALVASLLTTVAARAQAPTPNVPGAQPRPTRPAGSVGLPGIAPGSLTLHGHVFDQKTQEPVPFASIGLTGLEIGKLCDEYGNFTLTLSAEQLARQTTDTLIVQGLGYVSYHQIITLRDQRADTPLAIPILRRPSTLNSDGVPVHVITMGVIVRTPADTTRSQPAPKQKRRNSRR